MTEAEICGGNTQDFPAFNSGILVEDVRFNGVSLITNNLSDVPLIVDATETGERWKLNGIVADVVEDTWQGADPCGHMRVRNRGFGPRARLRGAQRLHPGCKRRQRQLPIRGLDGYMAHA